MGKKKKQYVKMKKREEEKGLALRMCVKNPIKGMKPTKRSLYQSIVVTKLSEEQRKKKTSVQIFQKTNKRNFEFNYKA